MNRIRIRWKSKSALVLFFLLHALALPAAPQAGEVASIRYTHVAASPDGIGKV